MIMIGTIYPFSRPACGARPRRTRAFRTRRGITLLELGIAVTLIGILLAMVVPSFQRVSEQSRVDAASQYLRSIWSAQRVHWLENRQFTDSLSVLGGDGLIDPKVAAGADGFFLYDIASASADEFTVTATRNGSGTWSGMLTITQDGEVTGNVSDGTNVLLPPGI